MTATRREIAEAAGVSMRTVSNVMNGYEHVSAGVRERVLRLVEELDYKPNEIARSLRTGRSGLVAIVLPELATPYFAELTEAFVTEGAARGLTVIIDQADGDKARERDLILTTERGALFDGLIVSPLALQPEDLMDIPSDRPLVFLGESRYAGFDQVMIDNRAASREAIRHLFQMGARRIAAIGAEANHRESSSQRLEGYIQGLADVGLPFDESLIGYVPGFSRQAGADAAEHFLAWPEPPDAFFCFSDPLALGALWKINRSGNPQSRRISVVGFDDVEEGRFSTPTLTSVSPDKTWIARKSIELLSARIRGTANPPQLYLAPHRLVIRESSTVASPTFTPSSAPGMPPHG